MWVDSQCWRGLLLAVAFPGNFLLAQQAPSPKTLSIRIVPENSTLSGAKATQRVLVLAKFSDGLERDVTVDSQLSVGDIRFAKLDGPGKIQALADGKTDLRAAYAGKAAKAVLQVTDSQTARPFSFARDIGGIFTKNGCNSSTCHGGVKGQGGFKLSLNALYPEDDYKWIVEGGTFKVLSNDPGPKTPRIDTKTPEKSLLLSKPTMVSPHGGGLRFKVGSPEYDTILSWVRNGAPYGSGSEKAIPVEVARVEVYPKELVLDAQGKQQLLVTAYLTNGRQEDITDQVMYMASNTEVVKISPEGFIEAVAPGETSVMVRASGYAVSAGVGVIAKPIADYPMIARNNFVDDYVFAKLRKFNIVPSEIANDSEFLRRVCLDITGTLAPAGKVRDFLASKDPQKRQKLIETLLSSPEYVDYWTFRFAELFRVSRFANKIHGGYAQMYWEWIRDGIAKGKPYDQFARERIAIQGYRGPAGHYLPYEDLRRPEEKMAEQVRVFLGRRLDCAQCHNHPFEAWSQNQFLGMTAFFSRINGLEAYPGDKGSVLYDDPAGQETEFGEVGKSRKLVHPRTKEVIQPALLDGKVLTEQQSTDLRTILADWMTSSPYFSEAAVNRMWSYFFGRGIVDPVDDFRSTNPPTHPELLSALAKDFRDHKYDLKHVIRLIVTSRTYQLSSVPNETNRSDEINYSHALPRPLDAEVLLDAIDEVTGVPEVFVEQIAQDYSGVEPAGTRAINLREPDLYPNRFLDVFGRPNRLMVPERQRKANLTKALHMLAGTTFTQKLDQPGGRVDQLLRSAKSDQQIVEELYLLALSRYPTPAESSELVTWISRHESRPKAIRNLLWGLISSPEFIDNH